MNPVYKSIFEEKFNKLYDDATTKIKFITEIKLFDISKLSKITNFMNLVKELKTKIDRNKDIKSSLEKIKMYNRDSFLLILLMKDINMLLLD